MLCLKQCNVSKLIIHLKLKIKIKNKDLYVIFLFFNKIKYINMHYVLIITS